MSMLRKSDWTDDFARKISGLMKDHWNHTGYGEPQCFGDEGAIFDWYDRASLFELECPACEALYAVRAAWLGYRSQVEPTPDEVREYRLDATDPENARLNWREWRAHRGIA